MAGKRIIEDDDSIGTIGVAFQVRDEKRESKRAAITRAERILEARTIRRRPAVSKINPGVVDNDLIGGAGDTTGIRRLRLGNSKARVEVIE